MDIVYKFCGKHGLKILRNLELRVTQPNQFNDPFEFTPKVIYSDRVSYAKRALEREDVRKWLYQLYSKGRFKGSFSEYQKMSMDILIKAPEHTSPLFEIDLIDEVSKQFGILCLSQNRNSILMWGHYCDRSLGLIIGFDKASVIFKQGKGLRPVNYVNERVILDACWENGSPELLNYEEQITYNKSLVWKYEDELRRFFQLPSSSLIEKPLEDKDQTLGYFLPFPPEAVVSVTLGPRCSPELENEVWKTLQKPCFSKVKLDRAVINKDKFIMEFEPVQLTP
jgi:hypothetical protein